ncbi:hypothetical protein SAMD00079811_80530 (plasmid) [Scytonema sp. HK-05]|nr:hypothetical protein SAMD00079811_80530 [Scytonema sp. HK-05]
MTNISQSQRQNQDLGQLLMITSQKVVYIRTNFFRVMLNYL